MSGAATLVVELLTEELPPKSLKQLGGAFAETLAFGLRSRGFIAGESVVTAYATPRRLAVAITHVRGVAPDAEIIDKLMPRSVAEDAAGKSTVALQRRMEKVGRAGLAASRRTLFGQ